MQGWVKVHRKLMDNPIWSDSNYIKLWLYCLMKAAHKENDMLIGNQVVKVGRGQFVTGRDSLEKDMNRGVKPSNRLSALSWWRYLKNLENMGMLNIKSNNKYSVVSIDNYELYQSIDSQSDQQDDQEMNIKCSADDQQLITNKNVKNVKNDKKIKKYSFDQSHMKMAEYLLLKIKENKPDFKDPNMDSWADVFRKINELDKKDKHSIKKVIDFYAADDFWSVTIFSADKIRKHFEELEAQANRKEKGGGRKYNGSGRKEIIPEWMDKKEEDQQQPSDDVAERARKLQERLRIVK